jgi:hypothetical protein
VHQGCISLGQVKCDDCQRIIPHSERYLVVSEKVSAEAEKPHISRYCVECCLKRGYARYREEKGEQILTFFEE